VAGLRRRVVMVSGRRPWRPQLPTNHTAHEAQKGRNRMKNHKARRSLSVACATACTLALSAAILQPVQAHPRRPRVNPPPVPEEIQVPAGSRAFLEGHAVGTQNYVCLPSGAAFAWSLFTPEATLFDDDARQVITHFFGPSPTDGAFRPAWRHSRDTSTVWAQLIAPSSDPNFVAPGAIPWLRVDVVAAQEGPTGGRALNRTASIQRVNTSGGMAPSTGCSASTDVGKKAIVPYAADYIFYVGPNTEVDDDN
jgi:Protein of unknown function (DUF3455)